MAAVGEAFSLRQRGDQAYAALAAQWKRLSAAADIDDPVGLPGTGLIAFGALAFDPRSAHDSVVRVPSVVVGRRGGRSWVTTIHHDGERPAEATETPYGTHWSGTLGPGEQSPEGYLAAVRAGLDAIAAGEVGKVVLARDLGGTVPGGSDLRRLARALGSDYPDTWMFAVDGLIGASPETLVTVHAGTVTARVLAGTTPRGADADADTAAASTLASSTKDLDEHEFAVQSVLASLRPHLRALAASDAPFTLKLPNVWHLATDVERQRRFVGHAGQLGHRVGPADFDAGQLPAAQHHLTRSRRCIKGGRRAASIRSPPLRPTCIILRKNH
jgi:menaquinone-specific isochorismate synthase